MLSIDAGIVRRCFVSIAVSIPQDSSAFEVLQKTFINGFSEFYGERRVRRLEEAQEMGVSPRNPVLLDEQIQYVIQQLPVVAQNCQSLSYLQSPEQKAAIIERFLTMTQEEMLTSMAKRPTVRTSVRRYLHQQDTKGSHAAIDANKLDTVFTDFMRHFLKEYAASYRFDGSFIDHVMHSFTAYYYKGHSKDIWAMIQMPDFARQESESNLTGVTVLKPKRTDDLPVNNLFVNISEANDLMFKHAGQSDGARGVSYDNFYLIMLYLCENLLSSLNGQVELAVKQNTIGSAPVFSLELVDEMDRKESRNGISANTGIASKIANAKMMIPVLFERIREGNWSLDNITELRDQCFMLGKKDREGKNCVWKDVVPKGETSRYLDKQSTFHNFKAFERIFKGVLSIYTLMQALEERGRPLVSTYPDILRVLADKELARTVDYLSALDHLDLIYRFQHEDDPDDPAGHGELLVFDDMVSEYAGSAQNNHDNIRNNRYQAFSRGLLDNPKLKQAGDFQTPFDQLRSVAYYLAATPSCFFEYFLERSKTNSLPAFIGPMASVLPQDVVAGRYSSPFQNQLLASNPEIARYYLYDYTLNKRGLVTFDWHLGYTPFPSAILQSNNGEVFCLYVPMRDTFLLCPREIPTDKDIPLLERDIRTLNHMMVGSTVNGRRMIEFFAAYEGIPWEMFTPFFGAEGVVPTEEQITGALKHSMCFDCYLGIDNLDAPYLLNRLGSINVYPAYKAILLQYTKWMAEMSILQNSLVDLLYLMLSYGLYVSRCSNSQITGQMAAQGYQLVLSLLKSEFTEDNLNWFFAELSATNLVGGVRKVNTSWNTSATADVSLEPCDLVCLKYISGQVSSTEFPEDSFNNVILASVEQYETPAQRFVQLYNGLNTRLNYLHVLRDSYSLVFNVVSADLSTLGCELNSRFEIEEILLSASGSTTLHRMLDSRQVLLDTLTNSEIVTFVKESRFDTWQRFATLGRDLLRYFGNCRQDIAKLIDYDVTSSAEATSEMQQYGSMFFATGRYNDQLVDSLLKSIRGVAKMDDAGFLMSRNSYFRGRSGGNFYYVHVTGRLLEVGPNNALRPMSFDFSKDNDRVLYESIVREAYNAG